MNDFEAALDARNRPRRGQLLREWIALLPKDKADMLHEALSDRRYGTSLIVRALWLSQSTYTPSAFPDTLSVISIGTSHCIA